MTTREIEVTLSLLNEPNTQARATVLDRNPASRLGRAAVMLLAMWGVGAVCILLPIAHFVLVPGFFLAGVGLAVARLRDSCSLVQVEGVCPRCHVERIFPASGRFRDGRQVHCAQCGSQLTVDLASAETPILTPATGTP